MKQARVSDGPRPDPIGSRIREVRLSRGMSLQHLAVRVGVAPSHIFHIEKGDKVPSESLATRIAQALGESQDLFRAWARARSRTDVYTALDSARVLARYLGADAPPETATGGWAPPPGPASPEDSAGPSIETASGTLDAPGPARVLVPVLDLDERGAPRTIETLRLDPRTLGSIALLERPFALALTSEVARRTGAMLPPHGHAILTRFRPPVDPQAIYAVHEGRRVVLTHAIWNGEQLLLLPAPGHSDFVTLPVGSGDDLARHIAGRVVLVRPGA